MCRPLALLLPLLLLSGCAPAGTTGVDTGRFRGAQKDVAKALDDLASAARKRDGAQVCSDLLSRRLVAALPGGARRCASTLDDQLDDADVFGMDVDSIGVAGARATARVRSNFNGHKQARTLELVLEQRHWKLDRIR